MLFPDGAACETPGDSLGQTQTPCNEDSCSIGRRHRHILGVEVLSNQRRGPLLPSTADVPATSILFRPYTSFAPPHKTNKTPKTHACVAVNGHITHRKLPVVSRP